MSVMSLAAAAASAYFNCLTRMVFSRASRLSRLETISTIRRTLAEVSVTIRVLLAPLEETSASVPMSGCRSCLSFTASTLRTGMT